MKYHGAIEAGGTKFICLIANSPEHILAECRIQTTQPEDTLLLVRDFFSSKRDELKIDLESIGLGCFGPLDLNQDSNHYGSITSTPKPGWQGINIPEYLSGLLNIPVFIETDVNAAALGEKTWGNGVGLRDLVYLTIGTGIGGSAIVDGKPLHGMLHTEMGHIFLKHDLNLDPFRGICPFHHDCFEGLASGPAIEERWGKPGKELPSNHPAWNLETNYIAQALQSVVLLLSPNRIILGGGVMQQKHLFPKIRSELSRLLNGYIQTKELLSGLETYIVPPKLGQRAGVLGALSLAISKAKM